MQRGPFAGLLLVLALVPAVARSAEAPATCVWCGQPSTGEAVWARAY